MANDLFQHVTSGLQYSEKFSVFKADSKAQGGSADHKNVSQQIRGQALGVHRVQVQGGPGLV